MGDHPSIGDIVLYHCTTDESFDNNGGTEAPAVVVRVNDEYKPGFRPSLNLRVLFDGPTVGWKTSVKAPRRDSNDRAQPEQWEPIYMAKRPVKIYSEHA